MFFWKKERQVREQVEAYLQETVQALDRFQDTFGEYFAHGLSERFEALVHETHGHEAAADDSRREIEQALYDQALIPESRGDILGLLEAVDLVPNKAESACFQVSTEQLVMPAEFAQRFEQIVHGSVAAHENLCRAVRALFDDPSQVGEIAVRVSECEGRVDAMEQALIRAIFASDLEMGGKIQLKDLVLSLGSISDRAENASDRVRIISVKRRS